MKNAIYLFTVLSFGLLMNSCSGDDDGNDSAALNTIQIGDTANDIISVLAEDYGYDEEDESYNIDLTLFIDESGEGEGIYIEAFSSTEGVLETGTYAYNETASPLTFDLAAYFSDIEEDNSEIVSGTITITKSEKDYYELTFDFVDDEGKIITGAFQGDVNYTDDTEG